MLLIWLIVAGGVIVGRVLILGGWSGGLLLWVVGLNGVLGILSRLGLLHVGLRLVMHVKCVFDSKLSQEF